MRIWTRLIQWVDEEARSAQMYLRISRAALQHQEGQAGLMRDPELQLALNWRDEARPERDLGGALRSGVRARDALPRRERAPAQRRNRGEGAAADPPAPVDPAAGDHPRIRRGRDAGLRSLRDDAEDRGRHEPQGSGHPEGTRRDPAEGGRAAAAARRGRAHARRTTDGRRRPAADEGRGADEGLRAAETDRRQPAGDRAEGIGRRRCARKRRPSPPARSRPWPGGERARARPSPFNSASAPTPPACSRRQRKPRPAACACWPSPARWRFRRRA